MSQQNSDDKNEAQHGPRQTGEKRSGQASPRAWSHCDASIPVWLMITSLSCFSFGSGFMVATLQEIRNDRRALTQARFSDGERARQLSGGRLLEAVEACADPGGSKTSTCCSALPGLIAGETWAFCASPIR